MPWRSPHTAPFTRIGIVSEIPSESGVFGLVSGDEYLLVSETWNLKARLLDLINTLTTSVELTVVYELCPENEGRSRRSELETELVLLRESTAAARDPLPGISFWSGPELPIEKGDGREL